MRRNLDKKRFSGRRASQQRRGLRFTLLTIFVLLCLGSGWLGYHFKQHTPTAIFLSNQFTQWQTWIAEHKAHWHQSIQKVKQIATNQHDADPEIHFEFYTTLPNMQMQALDEMPQAEVKPSGLQKTPKHIVNEGQAKPKVLSAKKMAPRIVSADDLEREFAQEIKKEKD